MAVSISRFVLNLLFPHFCCGCQVMGTYLCRKCFRNLSFYDQPINVNLSPSYLDQLWSCVHYQSPATELIHTLKYQSVKDISNVIAQIMQLKMKLPTVEVVTAVPLHKKRLLDRGFNQAEIIAKTLAQLSNIPYQELLVKQMQTKTQASLENKEDRLTNLENSFSVNSSTSEDQIIYKSVLLIDDVTTTGATLNECARILKQNGIKQVFGMTFAHG